MPEALTELRTDWGEYNQLKTFQKGPKCVLQMVQRQLWIYFGARLGSAF